MCIFDKEMEKRNVKINDIFFEGETSEKKYLPLVSLKSNPLKEDKGAKSPSPRTMANGRTGHGSNPDQRTHLANNWRATLTLKWETKV